MRRILIVDDDAAIRSALEMVLALEGYEVIVAGDGDAGLVSAIAERPDLIISDVMMPGLTGFELCRRLRRDAATADIPIILNSSIEPRLPLEQNWDKFLRKPVDITELLRQIESLLSTR